MGINFDHILAKSLTVLNPLKQVDPHIMDDADLAGPLVFCFVFASFLLLVRSFPLSSSQEFLIADVRIVDIEWETSIQLYLWSCINR